MAPRSAKAKAKAKIEAIASEEPESDIAEDDNGSERAYGTLESVSSGDERENSPGDLGHSRPNKRARIAGTSSSTKRIIQKKNKPDIISNLPLDILYEIFGKIHVKDLFILSRTTKAFRAELLSDSKTMTTVWENALAESGTPECPGDMTIRSWVSLLYNPNCQVETTSITLPRLSLTSPPFPLPPFESETLPLHPAFGLCLFLGAYIAHIFYLCLPRPYVFRLPFRRPSRRVFLDGPTPVLLTGDLAIVSTTAATGPLCTMPLSAAVALHPGLALSS
ncbi:hypothetical protein CVT25_004992 [Psilocybe cyanescens]|uniref:F-box domain-containing protein n=1 Tax=Psilocybe cyanescens TaxID=93625 RepID=A0A409X281_PSICY|nr:hypothetical protein CVT25_004992 [Psilocybe cyanescens]